MTLKSFNITQTLKDIISCTSEIINCLMKSLMNLMIKEKQNLKKKNKKKI